MLEETRIWRRIGLQGLEHLTLRQTERGYLANSVLSVEADLGGVTCEYSFDLDEHWRTRSFQLQQHQAGDSSTLAVGRREDGWWVNGALRHDLDGALDLDISVSPFTNTLALRQLLLRPSEAKEMTAIYVKIPQIEVTPASQRYKRLDENDPPRRFLYSGLDTGFTEEITVDDLLLVERYPRFAERIG